MDWLLVSIAFTLSVGFFFLYAKNVCSPFSFIGGVLMNAFLIFVIVPGASQYSFGSPAIKIKAGEYKVVFVYVAGKNINIGVEEPVVGIESLHLYQLTKEAFDGIIPDGANRLSVVEGRGFKRYKLYKLPK